MVYAIFHGTCRTGAVVRRSHGDGTGPHTSHENGIANVEALAMSMLKAWCSNEAVKCNVGAVFHFQKSEVNPIQRLND